MKKRMIKLAACMMAITMASASVLPAYAATEDIIDKGRKGSITLHKYDLTAAQKDNVDVDSLANNGKKDEAAENALKDYAIEGVEFSYVRVGDIWTETEGGRLQLLYDIPADLEGILQMTDARGDHRHSSDALNKALNDLLANETDGKNALEAYMEGSGAVGRMELTDKNGVTTKNDLDLGLYLFVETKVPENVNRTVSPFFVSLPMTDREGNAWFYDVDAYPKNQTNFPDLDKLAKQADDEGKAEYTDTVTASEGDVVKFSIVSHLPAITSSGTYLTEYGFVDEMDKGITYGKDEAVYFYDNAEDAKANNTEKAVAAWANKSKNYSVTYQGQKMTLQVTAEGLKEINPGHSGQWMVVSYTGTVNSDATPVLGDKGNKNDVKLTWKRTSANFSDTIEDEVKVYTYGLDLQKNFSQAGGDATKVKFSLYNSTDKHFVTAKKEADGVYRVTDGTKGATEDKGTAFSPAANGKLLINGLEADTYVLTELATDSGYSLLKEPMTIVIKGTQDTITASVSSLYSKVEQAGDRAMTDIAGERASATVDKKKTNMSSMGAGQDESTNAYVDMEVLNTKSFTLPKTGGAGTFAFTLGGCMAALAGCVIAGKRKKEK